MILFDDEDYDDYYLGDDEERPQRTPAPAHPEDRTPTAGEKIVFTPERSDNEPALSNKSGFGFRKGCGCAAVALFVIAAVIAYFRYFSPTVDDAVMEVCVVKVEKRGVVFKTYEAEVVDPQKTADQSTPYSHPRSVTIENEDLARRLQSQQSAGKTVKLHYRTYSATLPWRGESKTIVYAVD